MSLRMMIAALALAGTASAAPLTVYLDQTQAFQLSGKAAGVAVGNPAIADISVHSQNMVLITGKGLGETNFLALNDAGEVMLDVWVKVQPRDEERVRMARGGGETVYACNPTCHILTQAQDEASGGAGGVGDALANTPTMSEAIADLQGGP